MIQINLNTEWTLTQSGHSASYPAPVPGTVHDALLDARVIPDAHYGFNEREQLWVGKADWVYQRDFEVSSELISQKHIQLVFEGLDTYADIYINEVKIGTSKSMYCRYAFELKTHLREGQNSIRVVFHSPYPRMEEGTAQRLLPAWNESTPESATWGPVGRGYVRKQACQFGWDWGMQSPSAGIWLPVRIEARNAARIADWRVEQFHQPNGSVELGLHVHPDTGEDLQVEAELSFAGEIVARIKESFFGGWEWRCAIGSPQIWWPNGMGAQALYSLKITLFDAEGNPVDSVHKKIGLRQIELIREPDGHGTSLCFAVNGVRFFAKGSNWIPLDAHPSSRDIESRYRRDLTSAVASNMNMLRVWGGGYFAHDCFYDLCDELGLLVWQDFMFGCGAYPAWDANFQKTIWQEVVDNARRLRHHPCLACWCGNNELEMGFTHSRWIEDVAGEEYKFGKMAWTSYLEIFERIIPSALALADPDTAYIPGSPHGAADERRDSHSPRSGDYHLWEIWFQDVPFENYRNYRHRFMSEFGFQSFPDIETLRPYAPDAESLRLGSEWLEFRQRSHPKNVRIVEKVKEWFGDEDQDLERFCTLSQIAQGEGLKIGMSFWRSLYPQVAGATYWQLNDRWAAPTWATLDYHGHWKASQYIIKRCFAPLLISAIAESENGQVEITIINDHPEPVSGQLLIQLTDLSGEILYKESREVTTATNGVPMACGSFVAGEKIGKGWSPEQCLVWLDFTPKGAGEAVVRELVRFALPTQFRQAFSAPQWSLHESDQAGLSRLRVTAGKTPLLWFGIRHPRELIRADDLFFHLLPCETREVRISHSEQIQTDELAAEMKEFYL